MRKFFVWPLIIAIVVIGYLAYERFYPCNSGMFIGGCGLGKWIVSVMLLESLIIYAVLSRIYSWWKTRNNRQISRLEFVFLGLLSLFVVFAGLFSNSRLLGLISLPFMGIGLGSISLLTNTPLEEIVSTLFQFFLSIGNAWGHFLRII